MNRARSFLKKTTSKFAYMAPDTGPGFIPDSARSSGGGSGGGNQQQNGQQNGQNGQGSGNGGGNNNNNDNNNGTNTALIDTLWQQAEGGNAGGQGGQGGNGQNGQGQQGGGNGQQGGNFDPNRFMADHLKSVGLGEFELSEGDIAELQGGNFANFTTKINQRIQTAYQRALTGANQLIDKKVKEAVEKATNDSKSYFNGERIREALYDRFPWAKSPAIGPVAESVLRQFLTKDPNMALTKALDLTERYFDTVDEARFPGWKKPMLDGRPPAGPNDTGDADWLSVLRGK